MNLFIRIWVICLVACHSAVWGSPPQKIINGLDVNITKVPHQVSLHDKKNGHFCGGSIIDTIHILTAAHCFLNDRGIRELESFAVKTGIDFLLNDNLGEIHEVKEIKWHEKYDPRHSYKNDIAIVTLAKPIVFSSFQKPIRLPTRDVPLKANVMFNGWGANQDYVPVPSALLQTSDFQIVENKECQKPHLLRIYSTQLCAWRNNETNLGWGDSGGGLNYHGEIVGIASWVEIKIPEAPHIFTRVYSYLQWIRNALNHESAGSAKSIKKFRDTFESIFKKIPLHSV